MASRLGRVCWVGAGHDIWPVVSVTARSVCELMKPCLRLVIRPQEKVTEMSTNWVHSTQASKTLFLSSILVAYGPS